jgi:hypothetical protein
MKPNPIYTSIPPSSSGKFQKKLVKEKLVAGQKLTKQLQVRKTKRLTV